MSRRNAGDRNTSSHQQQQIALGVAAVTSLSLVLYLWWKSNNATTSSQSVKPKLDDIGTKSSSSDTVGTDDSASIDTTTPKNAPSSIKDADKTPLVRNTTSDAAKSLAQEVEDLDKKGKALFKKGELMSAANVFTEAIKKIEESGSMESGNIRKLYLTFLNNRSAMYEKSKMYELAAADSERVLELDMSHSKARTRLLRLYELLERWSDAIVQVCATQLIVMQQHRQRSVMMGTPQAPPQLPISQAKMEEILQHLLSEEMPKYNVTETASKMIPATYAILQFLKSYADFSEWTDLAKQDEPLTDTMPEDDGADKVAYMFKRGRLHAYTRRYRKAIKDIEQAMALLDNDETGKLKDEIGDDLYKQVLEWTGMVKHWQHDFEASLKYYEQRQQIDKDARIMVKIAGVYMDNDDRDKALQHLSEALETDSKCVDAMFHRANLYMMQQNPEVAKADLEQCVSIKPDHVMAHLRLAAILAATGDNDGAMKEVDVAESHEPFNSEVHSYRGELYFTRNEMSDALAAFEKAIELEPANPTPYINAAMTVLNSPPPTGGPPDVAKAIELLEQAIEVDPQFSGAYIQLGQLKLGTSTNIREAENVISLYDQALDNCRSPDELKELCSMRILAVAQVEAATLLKMETFSMG